MEIRQLTLNDYEEMAKLWSRAGLSFRPKGRDSKEAITAEMKINPDFFLGAYEDNQLIGLVVLSCDGRRGWLNRLAVDPEYQRCGIAKALIAESEKVLRRHGVRMFCVLIDDGNEVSMSLFKKCGYVGHRGIVYFSKRESEDV
jgi:ribosomal protein S18 acetylase RimI-like enzyme